MMKMDEITKKGEETTKNIMDTFKRKASEAGKAVNEGLVSHGIDAGKLGQALGEDAKNAGNFIVGGAKVVIDKAKDAAAHVTSTEGKEIQENVQDIKEQATHIAAEVSEKAKNAVSQVNGKISAGVEGGAKAESKPDETLANPEPEKDEKTDKSDAPKGDETKKSSTKKE